MTVAYWARVRLIRTIIAIGLTVAFPVFRDTFVIISASKFQHGAVGDAGRAATLGEDEVVWAGTSGGYSSNRNEAQMGAATIVGTTWVGNRCERERKKENKSCNHPAEMFL